MNETGSIPFFTSENSSRSWEAFFGAVQPLGRALGARDGWGECWVRARVGAVGVQAGHPAVARPGFGMGSVSQTEISEKALDTLD